MPRETVVTGKAQVGAFQIRSRARTADLERRSMMQETTQLDHEHRQELQELAERDPRAPQKLANAEETITRLVGQSAAFMRTFEHLVQAWGPTNSDPAAYVEATIEGFQRELEADDTFQRNARNWAQGRIENGPPTERPKLRRKPKR